MSQLCSILSNDSALGLPGGSVVKNPPANAGQDSRTIGDKGSVPGLGGYFGGGNGNPLQYSCQEDPMDRGAWWTTVRGVTKSQTRLSNSACTFSVSTHLSTLSQWGPEKLSQGLSHLSMSKHPTLLKCALISLLNTTCISTSHFQWSC